MHTGAHDRMLCILSFFEINKFQLQANFFCWKYTSNSHPIACDSRIEFVRCGSVAIPHNRNTTMRWCTCFSFSYILIHIGRNKNRRTSAEKNNRHDTHTHQAYSEIRKHKPPLYYYYLSLFIEFALITRFKINKNK